MLPPAQLELVSHRYDLFTLNQLKFITYTKQAGFFSLRQIQALQAGAYRAEEHRDRFAQVLKLQHGRAC